MVHHLLRGGLQQLDPRLRSAPVCGEHTALRAAAAGALRALWGAQQPTACRNWQLHLPACCCLLLPSCITTASRPLPLPHLPPPDTPPTLQFLSVLMRPNAKHTARLRKLLAQTFGGVGSEHYSAEGAGGDDMFPYVCFTLNIE